MILQLRPIKEALMIIVLMFLRAGRAFSNFEVCSLIGRISLTADFVTKADGGKNSHRPNWVIMAQ